LLQSSDPESAQAILVEMEPEDATDVRALLAYPPNTAGGRMTPEFFAVTPQVTADEAIHALRALVEDAEFRSYLYVTDSTDRLLGIAPLHNLVLAQPETPVGQFMAPDPIKVRAGDDQEEVARTFHDSRLLAIPVVDDDGRLLGIITADDIADVIEAEDTEDVQRLGGSQPLDQPYLRVRPFELAKKRVGWLLLLFLGATYTGTVLRHFESQLEAAVALTFFIPLLIGTGGNVGSQTVMTVIRAMAVGEVRFGDLFRVWRKEIATAALLATVLAVAAVIRAWTLGVGEDVALTVAISTAVIVLWAATVAAILPLVIRRFRVDPAVVSAPLITTVVDGTGLFIYFEVARRLLSL
jgi:magnesium transporter